MYKLKAAEWRPEHFKLDVVDRVATITLNRPERKNPLTFESYAELRDTFIKLQYAEDVRVVVITGAGGNFCSGGDVHDIIGPLTRMNMDGLLAFTRMTGNLVKEMRNCPQPIISAVDGICAGAGAIISMASDMRYATPEAKTAFLFVRVGLAGCDMGACSILPRIIGHGRASELLYTGRSMSAEEGRAWGYFNDIVPGEKVLAKAQEMALSLANGPAFAHSMTKKCLHQEWNQTIEQALETEAEAQAICMQTKDFERAYTSCFNTLGPMCSATVARNRPRPGGGRGGGRGGEDMAARPWGAGTRRVSSLRRCGPSPERGSGDPLSGASHRTACVIPRCSSPPTSANAGDASLLFLTAPCRFPLQWVP